MQTSLYKIDSEGNLEESLLKTDKRTFCIQDYAALSEPSSTQPKKAVYPENCSSDVQGISVGWVDTYTSDIEGQAFDITDIPNGRYGLKTVVDPDNQIMETDNTNNTDISYLEIQDDTVRLLSKSEF